MRKEKLSLKMSSAFTAGMLVASNEAFAGGKNFVDITGSITGSVARIPDLLTTIAYLGGIGLAIAGILKLRDHVNAPQQVPLKDGLIRLGCGGALLALPIVLEAMQNTVGNGTAPKVPAVTGVGGFAP